MAIGLRVFLGHGIAHGFGSDKQIESVKGSNAMDPPPLQNGFTEPE
jgi:hypothetical protein